MQWKLLYPIFLANSILIVQVHSYDDKDLKCSTNQHLGGFIRKTSGKTKEITHKCGNFSPKLSKDVTCYPGTAFKCNGNFEGCDNPAAWIDGFQVFDMGDKVETYVPYCCTSPEVTVRNTKCRQVTLAGSPGANVNYAIPNDRVMYRFACEYSKALIGQKLNGMKMSAEDCNYAVEKKRRA